MTISIQTLRIRHIFSSALHCYSSSPNINDCRRQTSLPINVCTSPPWKKTIILWCLGEKAPDRILEWLWQKKDPLWFMRGALGTVWCEVSSWRAMNNSALGSITSSLFPCYCCFYVIAKWKINWCHKESCIICLEIHIRVIGTFLLLCEPCMILLCAKLKMCLY